MYVLTEEQIDYIHNDLRARGVEREDLQLNLLDHICCVIEDEFKTGGDFRTFYADAIKRFYRKELREIEEETTLLLTFKHYYAMKKTMIISGVISAICFITGTVFKFNHWPGAGIIFVLAFAIFALLFLPLMSVLKMRENKGTRNKIVLIAGTLLGITAVLGVLFKVMHWPGASILMYVTVFGLMCAFIPLYFFSGIRNPEYKVNTIVTTVLLVGGAGMLMSLMSVKPTWYYMNMNIQSDGMLRNEVSALNKVALRYENFIPKDSAVAEKRNRIKAAADDFMSYSDQLISKIALALSDEGAIRPDMDQVSVSNNYYIPNRILFGEDKTGETGAIKDLRNKLEKIEKLATENGIEFKIINDDSEINGKKVNWQVGQFHENVGSVTVRKLMMLQLQVRTAEIELLGMP